MAISMKLTGILAWNYHLQLFIENAKPTHSNNFNAREMLFHSFNHSSIPSLSEMIGIGQTWKQAREEWRRPLHHLFMIPMIPIINSMHSSTLSRCQKPHSFIPWLKKSPTRPSIHNILIGREAKAFRPFIHLFWTSIHPFIPDKTLLLYIKAFHAFLYW